MNIRIESNAIKIKNSTIRGKKVFQNKKQKKFHLLSGTFFISTEQKIKLVQQLF